MAKEQRPHFRLMHLRKLALTRIFCPSSAYYKIEILFGYLSNVFKLNKQFQYTAFENHKHTNIFQSEFLCGFKIYNFDADKIQILIPYFIEVFRSLKENQNKNN